MKKIILSALLFRWSAELEAAIVELEERLPLERQFETRYEQKNHHAIYLFKSPETEPELYNEHHDPLPHAELDRLRKLAFDIDELASALVETPDHD